MHTLTLSPPAGSSTSTRIRIGDHAISEIKNITKNDENIVMIFDEGIRSIADDVASKIPNVVQIPVASGDVSKSLSEVDRIVALMLEHGCTRKSLIIAVGGGMLTDLAGFVASIYMRGIPCVLVPTTLLGMVDAAIGGKTAVNAGACKNIIGTITHPTDIFIDTSFLQSLPLPQMQEGLAEMIKIAAITDAPYFEWLQAAIPTFLKRDAKTIDEAVLLAVTAKMKIVEQDERDRDVRLLLNFGHTVGHAVEALSGFKISHGKAVSIGMCAEMNIARCSERKSIEHLLALAGLPLTIPEVMKGHDLWILMQSDKKNQQGEVKIAVPKRLGEGAIETISEKQFASLFA